MLLFLTGLYLTLFDPRGCSIPDFPVLHYFLKLVSFESSDSNYLILCHPFLLLPSIFPSIRVFFPLSWLLAKVASFGQSVGISRYPSNEYSGLISFRIDWFISLQSKEFSRIFSSTTIQKYQFFSAQPSLWSNFHIHM